MSILTVLFDTNTIIAALNKAHPHHAATVDWLLRVHRKEIIGIISAHTLAELYAYFTGHAGQSPRNTRLLFERDILGHMQVVSLTEEEYVDMIMHVADLNLSGAVIYDAIHAATAIKANVDKVLTINKKDFYRVYPQLIPRIVIPKTEQKESK